MALDPEIMDGFRQETAALLKEASAYADQLDGAADFAAVEKPLGEFAIRIDRIMGAAKTIAAMDPSHGGLQKIGSLAQICKSISYKTIDKKALALVPLISAFFADSIECVEKLLGTLENKEGTKALIDEFTSVTHGRLELLAKHLA
jgi:hypothetical protein